MCLLRLFRRKILPSNGKPWYAPDTNVCLDCPDVFPNGGNEHPSEANIDMRNANIIIMGAVLYELDRIVHDEKKDPDVRNTAREVIRRVHKIVKENFGSVTFSDLFNLKKPMKLKDDDRYFYILPLHKNFIKSLPFELNEGYADDVILATVFAAKLALHGVRIDGKARKKKVEKVISEDEELVLITNDCRFRITALSYGILALPFEYKAPTPYTGRRDLNVPSDLLSQFLTSSISRADWEKAMPDQPPLVANEYIVMYLESDSREGDDDLLYRRIGYYDVKADAIVHIKKTHIDGISTTNPGQVIYLDALSRPDIAAVIAQGPAGSGKTYISTIWSLTACKRHLYLGSIVVPRQEDNGLGALPGDLNSKTDLFVQPFKDSLRSYFQRQVIKKQSNAEFLEEDDFEEEVTYKPKKRRKKSYSEDDEAYPAHKKSRNDEKPSKNSRKKIKSPMRAVENAVQTTWMNWFQVVPIDNAKGRSFLGLYVVCDEFQDQNIRAAKTMLTRPGEGTKLVLTGDIDQIHAPHINRGNSGLTIASSILKDHPMAAQVAFLENEINRSEFVKLVVEKMNNQRTRNEE